MKKTALIILTILVLLSFSLTALAVSNSDYEKSLKYYNKGKYSEAVKILKEYVKRNPSPSAYYRTGYALYKLKKYDAANEYFKEAYLLDPSFSPEQSGFPKKQPKTTEAVKPAEGKAPQKQ